MCGSILVFALSSWVACASSRVLSGEAFVRFDACVGMRRIVLRVYCNRLWLALGFYLFDFSYLHLHGFFKLWWCAAAHG